MWGSTLWIVLWGRGALICALKNPGKYKAYDATCLVKSYPGPQLDILIDQGKEDEFLSDGQLLPDNFIAACTEKKIPVVFRLQEASIDDFVAFQQDGTDCSRMILQRDGCKRKNRSLFAKSRAGRMVWSIDDTPFAIIAANGRGGRRVDGNVADGNFCRKELFWRN